MRFNKKNEEHRTTHELMKLRVFNKNFCETIMSADYLETF